MITTEKSIGPATGPCYYRSFASYEIPFRPVDPVKFAETEGLRSFYVAYHDPNGRVARFDKRRLVRVAKEAKEVALSAAAKPGVAVYFEAIPYPATGEPLAGKPLHYHETEHRDEFFAGKVDGSGQSCRVFLFRREIAFTDVYEYWPNGRLKKRTMTGPDRAPSVAEYDQKGHQVSSPKNRERLHDAGKAKSHAGD